ncbi:DUF1292 domain-containing protein [bacterium D16-51]|nr:DUF1292 domain-containing protein [bacterium D16-59]RKI60899.1 DUF1292 domain-containing protein [bacterium D16-51]
MEEKSDCIEFETENGEKVPFYIVEETMLGGITYLLVADSGEEEADAYIMREVEGQDGQAVYEMVEEDTELEAVSKIFAELLEDVELEI